MKTKFMNKKKTLSCGAQDALPEALSFIESSLEELGVKRALVLRTELLAEELLTQFLQHAEAGSSLRIKVQKLLGDAGVTIDAPGREFDPTYTTVEEAGAIDAIEDEEAQAAIRSILLKSQEDKLKFNHKNGVNHARIAVGQREQSSLMLTVGALFAGLFVGFLMRTLFPAAFADGLKTYLLTPVRTMFMNALKVVIAPVVFFSIVSCFAQFKNLADLGRIAAKVMGTYMMTTLIAVFIGLGIFALFHPGTVGFALALAPGAEAIVVDTGVDTSLLGTIVNIVPSNFLQPFLESDTLQIIFLGVLCGSAVGMIGNYAPVLRDFFEACNSLFLTITTMITRLIPVAVFCSGALMVVDLGGKSLLSVLGFMGTELLAILCMILAYGLLILLFARLNPLTFFRKHREAMITSFTLSSSSASMPVNMRSCTEKLGISSRVASFSIPLGATVNMDGTSICLVVGSLFLARAYGVSVPGAAIPSLLLTIILLSLGAPGVPGAALVCLGIVLEQLGVPLEGLGLIMGIYPILDMFSTVSNTTGDVAATLITAKSEGLVDLTTYNA